MSQTTTNKPLLSAKQLIPLKQRTTTKEMIIPFDDLEFVNFSSLPRGTTLVASVTPSCKVLITKSKVLQIKLVYKISADHPLVKKHGVLATLRAMSFTTEIVPADQKTTKSSGARTRANWKLPDETIRRYELPISMAGVDVLGGIRRSDEFIVRTTESLLAQRAKLQELSAQL